MLTLLRTGLFTNGFAAGVGGWDRKTQTLTYARRLVRFGNRCWTRPHAFDTNKTGGTCRRRMSQQTAAADRGGAQEVS